MCGDEAAAAAGIPEPDAALGAGTDRAVSPRAAKRLAFGLVALTLSLILVAWVAEAAGETGTEGDDFVGAVLIGAFALIFVGVGALIATRHPGNGIGWIFLSAGVATGLAHLAGGYADRWTAGEGGSATLGEAAAWYANLSWIPFVLVPATFLLLLFPDGRLLSRRWRPVAWCAALGIAGVFVTSGLTPGAIDDYPQLQNPYAVESSLLDPLAGLAFLAVLAGLVGSSLSLVLRFRRARGVQRLQIKWLALAGTVAAVTFPVALLGMAFMDSFLWEVGIMLSVVALPTAAGIAILRHRLYDIDVVINRTLVYGALTATLAAVYVATVLVLQLALSGLTAGSDLAIAGSTLAVAAIFRPARARIQEGVDRRFFRRRYDARRTLEEFSSRLRDQVDLAALDAELRGVVAETMQPAHVSVWLRGAGE
jgi:hypothetical protein